jgi:RNA polymerase sigma-70 factor (sigma-E family)
MKAAQQAEAHFADFVQDRTDALLTTAYLLTRDRLAAEELVQDTLVSLYPQWFRVAAADSPAAYVRRALVNRFLNQRRGKRGSEVTLAALPERAGSGDFPQQLVDRDLLRRALSGLPDRQRVAIVLRYFHDYADQQIAEVMGCRIGTVRSLISRALSAMRGDPVFIELSHRGQQEVGK